MGVVNSMPEEVFISKEDLHHYFSEQNMYLSDIGKIYGCSGNCVQTKVKKYALVRNYQNKDWLEKMHLQEDKKLREMAELSHSSEDSIRRWMRKYGIDTRQEVRYSGMNTYEMNENFFEVIDSEEKAYWLGFILADGCLTASYRQKKSGLVRTQPNRLSIILSRKDHFHLELFKKQIDYTGVVEQSVSKLNSKEYEESRIRINSEKICSDLMSHGVMPRKSCEEIFPTGLRPELMPHFVRGYFDGDGSFGFYQTKGTVLYASSITFLGGEEFLSQLRTHIIDNVVSTRAKIRKPQTKNHIFSFGGKHISKTFMDWMYEDAHIYLRRKFDIYQSWLKVR